MLSGILLVFYNIYVLSDVSVCSIVVYFYESVCPAGSKYKQATLTTRTFDCCLSHQISDSLNKRLLDFHEKAGLVYGAYDFLECEDDVIFLECNTGGAWLWLEQALGLKVSEHIARYLLGREENDSS